jgi:pimeloyl-ACP methyl ester carboxylesterase
VSPTLEWELREHGPADAAHTALLLPGGMCSAGSYAELMAEPALAGMRLVAATLPGHAGAPPPDDYSVENYARLTSELVAEVGADVVVGFSMGAAVALELAVSGLFAGPIVLLGVSLSAKDEPAFFRGIVGLGRVLGGLPAALLAKAAASMVKRVPASPERRAELRADFARNVPGHVRQALREYLSWLQRGDHRAEHLCESTVPTWIVHAEKGDGGLTAGERQTLEACPGTRVVTLPGHVFFLPNEASEPIAGIIRQAAGTA